MSEGGVVDRLSGKMGQIAKIGSGVAILAGGYAWLDSRLDEIDAAVEAAAEVEELREDVGALRSALRAYACHLEERDVLECLRPDELLGEGH